MESFRSWSIALVVALSLAQAGSLLHALEHQLDGPGATLCAACATAEGATLDSAPGTPPTLEIDTRLTTAGVTPEFTAVLAGTAQPRAPPHSH